MAVSGTANGVGAANGNYRYDGNLKRVKSVVNGKTTYNVYDASGSLVHVSAITENKKTDYVTGPMGTLARITNDAVTYLHPDHLGSAQAGTNSVGAISWREQYTPFGEELQSPVANDNLAGFTGHIKDSATGLNYMQARYYDPVIGRFLSVDPVGFLDTENPGFFNRYAYTFNDPINMSDPDGRAGKKKILSDAGRALKNARARGRRRALKQEKAQLLDTGQSTSNLSETRAQELLDTGKLKNMPGHHDPSISSGGTLEEKVAIAEDPNNITFMETPEHIEIHKKAGGTQVPISSKGEKILGTALGVVGTSLEGLSKVPDPISTGFEIKDAFKNIFEGRHHNDFGDGCNGDRTGCN